MENTKNGPYRLPVESIFVVGLACVAGFTRENSERRGGESENQNKVVCLGGDSVGHCHTKEHDKKYNDKAEEGCRLTLPNAKVRDGAGISAHWNFS